MASKDGGKFALRVEAINSLLGQLIEPALKDEHGLEPIGQPALAVPADELAATFVPGEDIELLVKCDVWPEIQWMDSDGGKPYFGLTGAYSRKPFVNTYLSQHSSLLPPSSMFNSSNRGYPDVSATGHSTYFAHY